MNSWLPNQRQTTLVIIGLLIAMGIIWGNSAWSGKKSQSSQQQQPAEKTIPRGDQGVETRTGLTTKTNAAFTEKVVPSFENRDSQAVDVAKPEVVDTPKFNGWNMYSDGFTWNSAPDSEKHDLCRRLAQQSRTGNGAGYFYDGLNAFYSGAATLSTRLEVATRLLEAGGKTLPLSKRNY